MEPDIEKHAVIFESSIGGDAGVLLTELAALPTNAIVDETRLAQLLQVTPRTVRRLVNRFELPRPIRLGGRSVWLVGRILAYLDRAAAQAEREAERESERLRNLGS